MINQRKVEEFALVLEGSFPGPPTANTQYRMEHFRDAVYNAAMSTFGKKTSKSVDWFEAHSEEMTLVIDSKRNVLTACKANPSEQKVRILRTARSKVQQRARQCADFNWLQLCSEIQSAADTGNIKAMYAKQALGPMQKKTALLKSTTGEVIQDREQQMVRWVEHFTELYTRENVVTEDALNAIECLPQLEETLITELLEILCLCWNEGEVPQDMNDNSVVTLYKNKGDRSDCNNYSGIYLLSVVGKVFARVVLKRRQVLQSKSTLSRSAASVLTGPL